MSGIGVSAVTAYTAHREWASRPPDEHYASVQALYEAARARHDRKPGKPLTKRELYAHFRSKLGLTWSEVREYFEELERIAVAALKRRGEFTIPCVVHFVIQRRKARMVRYPGTGESFKLQAMAKLKARISPALIDAIVPKRVDVEKSASGGVRLGGPRLDAVFRDYLSRRAIGSGPSKGERNAPTRSFVGAGEPQFLRAAEGQLVRVFYGTDRREVSNREGHFTSQRSDLLSVGWCDVSVPIDQRLAVVERPSVWQLEFIENPKRHFMIICRRTQQAREFWLTLRATGATSGLVFIHGYNVAFDDAVYRTAQISYDLQFHGITMLYSWASNGKVLRYSSDVANNEFTIRSLKQFLCDAAKKSGVNVLHVIAHSMGNRALASALYELAISKNRRQLPRIENLILTAPDIDAGVFRDIATAMAGTAKRTTLYASSKDKALRASMRLHKYPRAGDASDIVVVEGIDSIDATQLKTDFVSHSYFGDHESVLSDVHEMMQHDAPPSRRFGLHGVPKTAPKYWQFRPRRE